MRRVLPAVFVVCLLAAAGLWIYQPLGGGARSVVFDLADRLPYAARAAEREVIMFGWPDAEPRVGPGMDGDPEVRGRERFLWARQGASLNLEVKDPKDRALIFDIEAYPGIEGQRLEVRVGGRSLGTQDVPSSRSRIRFDWPVAAQGAPEAVVTSMGRSFRRRR